MTTTIRATPQPFRRTACVEAGTGCPCGRCDAGGGYSLPLRTRRASGKSRKSAAILAHLSSMVLTPSMLDTYVRCPLCFYYRFVLRLREKEDLSDEPDSRAIGTLLHGFLEEAYAPLVGKPFAVDADFESSFWALFETKSVARRRCLSASFLDRTRVAGEDGAFSGSRARTGIASILSLEHTLEGTIPTDAGEIRIYGRADRIESLADGQLMVVDYKTVSEQFRQHADYTAAGHQRQ